MNKNLLRLIINESINESVLKILKEYKIVDKKSTKANMIFESVESLSASEIIGKANEIYRLILGKQFFSSVAVLDDKFQNFLNLAEGIGLIYVSILYDRAAEIESEDSYYGSLYFILSYIFFGVGALYLSVTGATGIALAAGDAIKDAATDGAFKRFGKKALQVISRIQTGSSEALFDTIERDLMSRAKEIARAVQYQAQRSAIDDALSNIILGESDSLAAIVLKSAILSDDPASVKMASRILRRQKIDASDTNFLNSSYLDSSSGTVTKMANHPKITAVGDLATNPNSNDSIPIEITLNLGNTSTFDATTGTLTVAQGDLPLKEAIKSLSAITESGELAVRNVESNIAAIDTYQPNSARLRTTVGGLQEKLGNSANKEAVKDSIEGGVGEDIVNEVSEFIETADVSTLYDSKKASMKEISDSKGNVETGTGEKMEFMARAKEFFNPEKNLDSMRPKSYGNLGNKALRIFGADTIGGGAKGRKIDKIAGVKRLFNEQTRIAALKSIRKIIDEVISTNKTLSVTIPAAVDGIIIGKTTVELDLIGVSPAMMGVFIPSKVGGKVVSSTADIESAIAVLKSKEIPYTSFTKRDNPQFPDVNLTRLSGESDDEYSQRIARETQESMESIPTQNLDGVYYDSANAKIPISQIESRKRELFVKINSNLGGQTQMAAQGQIKQTKAVKIEDVFSESEGVFNINAYTETQIPRDATTSQNPNIGVLESVANTQALMKEYNSLVTASDTAKREIAQIGVESNILIVDMFNFESAANTFAGQAAKDKEPILLLRSGMASGESRSIKAGIEFYGGRSPNSFLLKSVQSIIDYRTPAIIGMKLLASKGYDKGNGDVISIPFIDDFLGERSSVKMYSNSIQKGDGKIEISVNDIPVVDDATGDFDHIGQEE